MALLRRYLSYLVLSAAFLFFLYQLSFPYEPGQGPASEGSPAHQQQHHESYDWGKIPMNYPVSDMTPLPNDAPRTLPRIQHDFKDEPSTSKQIRESRQSEVKKQFLKCWKNYRSKAWMHDEMTPIAGGYTDDFGGWAATLIDSLDTLWIMDAREEFISAIKDVEAIDFGYTNMEKVNMFETNIRHLGGLLSAYELSREDRILNKAKEVGEMLYHAFDTPNHMPLTRWDFHKAGQGEEQEAEENVLIAELGSFTMEFVRLSQATGDPKWYDAAHRVVQVLEKDQMKTRLPGMWPIVVNPRKKDLTQDTGFSLGSMADSTYEYLPKTYALLGGLDDRYKSMYQKAMDAAVKYTLYRPMVPGDPDMLGTGFVRSEDGKAYLNPEFQHLSCYAGGMFALGGKLFENIEHVSIGRKLTDTCVWAYKSSPAGIMPEVSHLYKCENMTDCKWDEKKWKEEVASRADLDNEKDTTQNIAALRLPKGFTAISDRRYVLRPEAIESVFIMYRLTGEQSWQATAWDMWTAIMRATDTDIGNSALQDVSTESPPRSDSMESFWMAETLKYFYLIFSTPDTISLDDYVFNTEAHPFRIPKANSEQNFSKRDKPSAQKPDEWDYQKFVPIGLVTGALIVIVVFLIKKELKHNVARPWCKKKWVSLQDKRTQIGDGATAGVAMQGDEHGDDGQDHELEVSRHSVELEAPRHSVERGEQGNISEPQESERPFGQDTQDRESRRESIRGPSALAQRTSEIMELQNLDPLGRAKPKVGTGKEAIAETSDEIQIGEAL